MSLASVFALIVFILVAAFGAEATLAIIGVFAGVLVWLVIFGVIALLVFLIHAWWTG